VTDAPSGDGLGHGSEIGYHMGLVRAVPFTDYATLREQMFLPERYAAAVYAGNLPREVVEEVLRYNVLLSVTEIAARDGKGIWAHPPTIYAGDEGPLAGRWPEPTMYWYAEFFSPAKLAEIDKALGEEPEGDGQ